MIIGITCHGVNEYGITLQDFEGLTDRSVIMKVGEKVGAIELYEFDRHVAIDILMEDGLYNSDINCSGLYKLNKVEDQYGTMYNV